MLIYLITISNQIYLPYFKRNGPILKPERVTLKLLESFKNMGYNVTVVGTEEVDAQLAPIANHLPVTPVDSKPVAFYDPMSTVEVIEDTETGEDSNEPLAEDTITENESVDTEEEVITESEEDPTEEEVNDNADIKAFSKSELNKMNVASLLEAANTILHLINEEDLPLEGKTKKQLIELILSVS